MMMVSMRESPFPLSLVEDECGGGSVGDTVKSCGTVIWAELSVLVTSAKGVLVGVWVGGIVGAEVQPVQVKLQRHILR